MTESAPDFDFVLHPHRSLSPRGFLVIMGLIGGISFLTGILFILKGAWPVFGFCGLDVALVWYAFRRNFRGARQFERITATDGEVTVARTLPNGQQQLWQFPVYWARVDLETHHSGDNALFIGSHGRRVGIGRFIAPSERVELADALRDALRDARNPRFQPPAPAGAG